MRKVTAKVCTAFLANVPFALGNTKTDGERLFLHGNVIAEIHPRKDLSGTAVISLCGWNTRVTRERLNGLLEMLGLPQTVCVRQGAPYYGGNYPLDLDKFYVISLRSGCILGSGATLIKAREVAGCLFRAAA